MSRKWDLPPACLPLTFHLWCEGWTALLSAPSRPKPDCGWQGHRVRIQGRRALVFLGPLLWLSHLLLSDCLLAPLSSSAFRRRRFSPAHGTRPQNARAHVSGISSLQSYCGGCFFVCQTWRIGLFWRWWSGPSSPAARNRLPLLSATSQSYIRSPFLNPHCTAE